jgi:hypothetical protein
LSFDDFGRGVMWQEPDLASSMFERTLRIDPLCVGADIMIASLLGNRGRPEPARERCLSLMQRYPEAGACNMAMATLDTYFGNFERAVGGLLASEKMVGGVARIQLWSVHMSMGDREGALHWVEFGKLPFEVALSEAARFAMDGRYEEAYTALDRHRSEYPLSRLLDLPTAKLALIAGRPHEALA